MLDIQSITVAYPGRTVLKDVTLNLQPGEILSVVGPNGAGKSTLVRAVSGVHPLSAGQIYLAGHELSQLSQMERARYMAVVPQARNLPGTYTVQQTVLLGRTPYMNWLGHAEKKDYLKVEQVLEQTQTSDLANRQIGELSGGEQQRVLLARALAQDTPILLLDEPTTHLDLQHQSYLLNLIRKLAADHKLTVLIVLHDLNLAGLYSNRVALLHERHIQAIGYPQDVLTAENLSSVYQIPVHVIPHPEYGSPLILPDGLGEGTQLD